jgi:PAS domain S-box-containing protein
MSVFAGAVEPAFDGLDDPVAAHTVQLYDDDAALIEVLTRYVGSALVSGHAAVVLATDAHRDALANRLHARGLDVQSVSSQGRYVALDAADLLSRFMRDGEFNASCFLELAGGIIDRAATGADDQRHVAVFGELVALLAADGQHAAAVELERLWNSLAETRSFSLLCAYPVDVFSRAADGDHLLQVCAAHRRVIPSEGFTALDDDERLRAVAIWQQKARALESEVAAREAAQDLLARREAELAAFVDEAPVALKWVSGDGRILWANRAELDLLGYSHEEYVGRHIADFHADPDVATEMMGRLTEQETVHELEARLRHKDCTIRHVLISANALWERGEFVHIRCVTRDVSDEVIAHETRVRLAAIIDSSDDAIIGKTLDGIITSWNGAAQRLYGYSADEIVGRPITTIVPPERRAEVADIMARLARGERIAHHETERVRKDGTRVEVSVSVSPIHDRWGRIVGAAKIARDISERRALERQKQAFLEMVAHDLGSPLTAIQGYAQLMQRRETYNERAAAAIVAEASRMGRLVADVLTASRLDAGKLELRREPTDLVALARECAAQVSLLSRNRRIDVAAERAAVLGFWDSDRLTQVLTNLLDNAVKYAPDGEIVVRVADADGEARVAVIDNGPGLAPHERERIFERFFRTSAAESSAKGVGLGLYISKVLVEAHGGRLWAESAPGEGSSFIVALPHGARVAPVQRVEMFAAGKG